MLFRIMKRSRFNFILWYFILSVPFLQMFFYFDLFSILSYGISILSYGISSFNFIIQFHHSILSYGISSFLSLFCKCFSISIYFMNIYSLLFFFFFILPAAPLAIPAQTSGRHGAARGMKTLFFFSTRVCE